MYLSKKKDAIKGADTFWKRARVLVIDPVSVAGGTQMNIMKKLQVSALAFAYGLSAAAPALADDSEIYTAGVVGGTAGGSPNVLLLLDTSGSMLFPMYDKYPTKHPLAGTDVPTQSGDKCSSNLSSSYDCAKYEDDRRSRHLLNAVKRILENLDGNVRVGIGRYNDSSSPIGGRIIYPVRRIADPVGTGAAESRNYRLNSGTSDGHQISSDGTKLDLSNGSLVMGNPPAGGATYSQRSSSDQTIRVDQFYEVSRDATVLALGGYANSSGSARATAIGLKYANLNIPFQAQITSATLGLAYASGDITGGDSFKGPKTTDNGALSLTLSLQDSTAPTNYSDSGTRRVDSSSRSYPSSGQMAISVGTTELVASSTTKTVDITSLVQAWVNKTGWDETAALAMKLQGDTAYTTGSKNGRRISDPVLTVTYTVAAPGETFTGVRFNGLDIPRGSTINSAWLDFTADRDASGVAQFEIKADPAVVPAEFTTSAANHLDGTRWVGGNTTTWSPGDWTKDSVYSADIKTLLQQHVNQAGFCGGMGLALRLRQTGVYVPATNNTTRRFAYSYDGDTSKAPALRVNYTLPAVGDPTCLLASRAVSVRGSTDDGESISGAQSLTALTARLRTDNDVGLRFPNLNIPQGATIRSAVLKLKAANTPSARGNFTVDGALQANVATFGSTNTIGSLLGGKTSATQAFTPAAWSANTPYEFTSSFSGSGKANSGLVGIVQQIVDQGTWISGNALVLFLKGSISSGNTCGQNSYPCFYQADQGSASAATLTVTYESNNRNDGIKTVRQDLMELMDTMTGNYYGGGTPMAGSYNEAALYMEGRAPSSGKGSSFAESKPAQNTTYTQYYSPIDGGTCQSNNIIMLTDGAPTSDRDVSTGGTCSGSWDCMKKTAANLKTVGFTHGSPALQSYISTYTIGFGPEVADTESTAYKGLGAVATSGGGEFFPASDVDALVAGFETIFSRLADTNGTMASPGVAVNQLNRTQHLDQLYYGVFKPQTTKRWPGNLKRYRLDANATGGPRVVDSENRPAISTATKYFDVTAKSWWSSTTDGSEAANGGAAEHQTSALKVYTDNQATNAMSLLDSSAPPASMSADDVKWIQGYDVDNENGQGPSGFRQAMGSPMHAQPVMVAVNSTAYSVYVGTNDGLLHNINTADGTQNWSWLPSDLQPNVSALRANNALGSGGMPIYGLDGSWTQVELTTSKQLLIGGIRQGGSNYYALKVDKNPAVAPELQWVIRPASATEFGRLGRTWSQPQFTNVKVGGVITPVVVFGGGLDFSKYEAGPATPSGTGGDLGNAVYMVNARTGALVWWASSSATATTGSSTIVPALKYSVPGAVRVVDKNGDGLADHLYFGDVGGQVFRVDMDNKTTAPKLVKRVNLLAQLGNAETTGKANDRRFYEMPAVEYAIDSNNKLYAAVAIGSGDRTFPKSNQTTQERFFLIRDYDAARFDLLSSNMTEAGQGSGGVADLVTRTTPLKTTNLANLSSTFGSAAATAAAAAKGWYLNMPGTGEKVLSSPFIFSRRNGSTLEFEVNFNSFVPDSVAASGCSPVAGSTSAWSVSLANAGAVSNPNSTTASDRYTEGVAAGITGSGVPMVVDRDGDGQGDTLIELIGTGARDRGNTPTGLGTIQRTRWYDKRAN